MVSRAGKFFAAGGALAGMAAVAAVAASPVARDEVRWMARLARPLGPRTPGAPLPPVLPPGRVVDLPGRGEVFVRDSGETDLPPVLLLHGWTVSADLNFFTVYAELAGHYRILALDHRGHGRGMRSQQPFTLEDCADDAAALLRALDAVPAVVAGFSMGGAVAMLLSSRHPGLASGLVFSGTALEWRASTRERIVWRGMSVFEVALRTGTGDGLVARVLRETLEESPDLAPLEPWVAGEFHRGSPIDLAGAGRALAAHDGRPLAAGVDVPCAVVVTTRDRLVRPQVQRRLAEVLRAPVYEVDADHLAPFSHRAEFAAAMRAAIDRVTGDARPAG